MSTLQPAQVRAAAERLIARARLRRNRVSLDDAEAAVLGLHALRRQGITLSLPDIAAVVAAADRELIAHMRAICKVLPSLGRDPKPYETALDGNAPPELLPDRVDAPPPRARRGAPPTRSARWDWPD